MPKLSDLINNFGIDLQKIKGLEMSLFTRLIVSTMWQHMRCTSFVFDHLNPENKLTKSRLTTFYNLIGYCFYLPTYFIGPLILYSDFGPYVSMLWEKDRVIYEDGLRIGLQKKFTSWVFLSGWIHLTVKAHFLFLI